MEQKYYIINTKEQEKQDHSFFYKHIEYLKLHEKKQKKHQGKELNHLKMR